MFNNYLDFFTQTALIKAIAQIPYIPGQLGSSGLFSVESLTGTQLAIEQQPDGGASIVTSTERGNPSKIETLDRRKVFTFNTSHYRVDGAVYADEVLNARAAGANAVGEVLADRRNKTLARMRRHIDLTLEQLRLTALLTGTTEFGSRPAETTIAMGTDATKTRAKIYTEIIEPIEAALGGIPYTDIRVWCSSGFWEGILGNKEIRDAYLYTANAQQLTGDTRMMVSYGGVTFERYRGSGTSVITANKAIAVPVGVADLFIEAYAPADTFSQVGAGALGSPYYVDSYPIDSGNRGFRLEIQTNPVMICTRNDAIQLVGLT
ncbi:MAG: major capsid protein [Leptolyngbyaceae bacterium]|nr:major capsid protein [Leptolyngbyaceae bacterium]